MTRLSLNNLREQVISAGIKYIPAEDYFYTDLLYKVELSPKFKGLGGTSGKRGCMVDISNPAKARTRLAEFNTEIDLILSNAEHRQNICAFVDSLESVVYKSRMGGENNLFYFRDAAPVQALMERYGADINSITGPINDTHIAAIDKNTVVMRDKLYFNKFGFYIELSNTPALFDGVSETVVDFLDTIPAGQHRVTNHRELMSHPAASQFRHMRMPRARHIHPPRNILLYLANGEDYVFLKLMAGEHIRYNHEVMLFADLLTD